LEVLLEAYPHLRALLYEYDDESYAACEFSLPFVNKEEMKLKMEDIELLMYVVTGAAVIYLVWNHYHVEGMANKEVQDKQDHHDTNPGDWKGPRPKHPDVKKPQGEQIYGPRAPKLDPNQPDPSGGSGKNGSGVYPDIYGPESLLPPGHKDKILPGESSSDGIKAGSSSDPPPYDYVPAAEFPAGPAEAAPYLNDFSKILKYN
jgi:hypothetical protein